MIQIIIGSFLATLGFGILFNIKGKKLILAGIGGAIGGIVYHVCLDMQMSEMMSMFWGSIALSLYSEIFARVCKTPVTTFLVAALIPLVPGGGMYRTMLQAIQGNAMQALTTGIDTIAIAGILVLGILLVSTVMKTICKPRNFRRGV
ncbi:threonine/serine exporter family protein [Amedibacillus sp. YH-ame10]